jgi:UDP-N-acetylglucosamine 1-carboxyvinyltransferase
MSHFVIDGSHPLRGTITASGNKNAALALIPACLLTDQPVTLHKVPDIRDVRTALELMAEIGVQVDAFGPGSWRLQAASLRTTALARESAERIRASFIFSGPLIGRTGRASLPLPGGDMIGGRPLDTHIQGLRALGVTVALDARDSYFHMEAKSLHGGGYLLQAEASVTATENTIMAAVLAPGETIIDNAASEPHVRDLCNLLNLLGAKINGVGTNRLTIHGVERLGGGEYTLGADFMEVGSFIGAAAVTGGEIRIRNASPGDLRMVRLVYERLGVIWEEDGDDVVVPAQQPLRIESALGGRILEIKPLPWPGFPPDLMSIAVVVGSQSEGSVLLHDWMYESRFFFVDKLRFMGARVVLCDPHRVLVQGPSQLYANPYGVTSPDIRAGMAMVLAALCADGTSVIHNIQQIDRGYERIETKLQSLGANIERVG